MTKDEKEERNERAKIGYPACSLVLLTDKRKERFEFENGSIFSSLEEREGIYHDKSANFPRNLHNSFLNRERFWLLFARIASHAQKIVQSHPEDFSVTPRRVFG